MLVKNQTDQTLIQVADTQELIDPFKKSIQGREKAGEEVQPTKAFEKSTLIFPSGEPLPQCWTDPEYQSQ
jgi:hypothetical protein